MLEFLLTARKPALTPSNNEKNAGKKIISQGIKMNN